MVTVLFLVPATADARAVEDFVRERWVPGLRADGRPRAIATSVGDLMGGRDLPYARVLEVTFDSLPEVMKALESPSGQEAKRSMASFGVTTLLFETREL